MVVHSCVDQSTPPDAGGRAVTGCDATVTLVDTSRSCPQECAQVGEISYAPGHIRSSDRPAGAATLLRPLPFRDADLHGWCTRPCPPCRPECRRPTRRRHLGTPPGEAGDREWTARDVGAQPSRCPRVDNRKPLTTHNRPTGPFGR